MKKTKLLGFLCLAALWACDESHEPAACDGTRPCENPALDAAFVQSNDATLKDAGQSTSADANITSSDGSVASTDASGPTPSFDAGSPARADAGSPAQRSSGCGAAQHPPGGAATIDINGTARQYIVDVPANYDASKPYRLVFAWHGLGGTAAQIAGSGNFGYYGLKSRAAGGTLFVAGQGLETSQGGAGWPNTSGRDVAFVRALFVRLQGEYCIDEARVFSVGMSYGGIMSNTLGCQMGDVFRAIAPMSGSGPGFGGRGASCIGQVAAWLAHGNQDKVVAFAQGQGSRDHWLTANHCDTQSAATEPSPCVAYTGCDDGHPVHWCEFAGGHTIANFASAAIWSFFSQF